MASKQSQPNIGTGKTVSAVSGVSSVLAGLVSAYCASTPALQPYSGALVSCASLAGAGITYLIAGLINLWGFESPEVTSYKRKLKSDLKFIKAELGGEDLDAETKAMLIEQKRETIKLLASVSRTSLDDIKAVQSTAF